MSPRRIPAPVLDLLLVGLSLLDAATKLDDHGPLAAASAVVAALALFLRRRHPLPVLLVTLPAAPLEGVRVPALVALYMLASHSRRRAVLVATAVVLAASLAYHYDLPSQLDNPGHLMQFGNTLALAAAAVFFGQLVQTRRDLSLRLAEIGEVREHERLLIAQTILAKERTHLAREMHDVVSHQVSLIAVRAGALQVCTRDPTVKEAAATIRLLSVQTLDELRHMVSVLRASGSLPTELTPQPTLAELTLLVASSGVQATLDLDPSDDLPPPIQRAIYRTVQEALTNVRKHAPGANTTIQIHRADHTVVTTVTNTAPTRPALALPSAQHGLIGLHQRAETLGGQLRAGPMPDGGYRLHLVLPVTKS
jgi:Signal transduction histidine kinase